MCKPPQENVGIKIAVEEILSTEQRVERLEHVARLEQPKSTWEKYKMMAVLNVKSSLLRLGLSPGASIAVFSLLFGCVFTAVYTIILQSRCTVASNMFAADWEDAAKDTNETLLLESAASKISQTFEECDFFGNCGLNLCRSQNPRFLQDGPELIVDLAENTFIQRAQPMIDLISKSTSIVETNFNDMLDRVPVNLSRLKLDISKFLEPLDKLVDENEDFQLRDFEKKATTWIDCKLPGTECKDYVTDSVLCGENAAAFNCTDTTKWCEALVYVEVLQCPSVSQSIGIALGFATYVQTAVVLLLSFVYKKVAGK